MLAALTASCQQDLTDIDGVFYNGDHRRVHCGINLDTTANVSMTSLDEGLDRARDRGEVLELYAHHPGTTVSPWKIERALAGARNRGLAFFTYADFAMDREVAPGLALAFDDTSVDAWFELRPMLLQYGARITFFVSRYYSLPAEGRAKLKTLAADGHDIEAHSVKHLRAPEYVEQHGLNAYVREEVDPSIEVLRNDGFEIRAFAYPFGARTGQLDDAIAKRVPIIRSVAFSYRFSESPCPQ